MLVDLYREYQFSIRSFRNNAQANLIPFHDIYRMTSVILPDIYSVKPLFTLPIDQDFQLLNGRYFTWLATLLMVIGGLRAIRHVWGWLIWLILAFLLSFTPAIHDVAFNTIFPQISAWSKPFDFATLHIPSAILMIWGLHTLIVNPWRNTWLIGIIGGVVLIIALSVSDTIDIPPRWAFVVFEAIILCIIALRSWWSSPRYIYVIALASICTSAFVTFPTIYRQAHADMYKTSEIHQIIKGNLDEGRSLIEISTPKAQICCFVRGNENIMFQIPTPHVYRSNISVYYANLIKRLGGTLARGNTSNYLQPRYNHPDFWMMNAGVIVSYQPQQHPSLELITTQHKLFIYRNTASSAGCCLTIPRTAIQSPIKPNKYNHLALNVGDIRTLPYTRIEKTMDQGDTFQLTNNDGNAAVIILNHVFHPSWYAYTDQNTTLVSLDTVVINQVYQGIIVPEGVTHITLQFTPWSRWMWGIHWVWLVLFGGAIIITVRRHTPRG